MRNFYIEKIDEIKALQTKNPQKALLLIQEELQMPYIPSKYESEFKNLESQIKFSLMQDAKNRVLSQAEIIEYLWSGNQVKEAIAIDNLKDQNIRHFIDDITKWIKKKEKGMGVAFIYEILVDQEVDINISFDFKVLNPTKDKSILDNKEVIKAFNTIISLSENEPSLQKALSDELKVYFLKTFPNFPKNGVKLANELFALIKKIMIGNNEFTTEEKKLLETIKG